uniref:Uncharacterized protein n=1 Tax=Arthrobacter sp. J3.40 TaxID=347209 RepID=I3W142_9MICC|nr:hypothetical protein [Arthrobacter sp. J3.40]AFK89319.1 hypothetical protein [Arthrobacter sp. J3.40]
MADEKPKTMRQDGTLKDNRRVCDELAEPIIDPDCPELFPDVVQNRLKELTQLSPLEALESEAAFIGSLNGLRLRAFHFSRLLPHELDLIKSQGLLPFRRDLFTRKIQLAVHHGYLDEGRASALMSTSMYGTYEELRAYFQSQIPRREGQVHACIGLTKLDDPSDFELLQGKWGGEGIYFATDRRVDQSRPQLGTPVMVELALRLDANRPLHFRPSLSSVLSRSEGESSGDVQINGAVAPSEIVRILEPGDADYDRHPGLSQS